LTHQPRSQRVSVSLAGAGVFAAIAVILTVAKAEVPFPIIPYLKIDFAEIPIVIVFFLFGPLSAAVSAVIEWIFLNFRGSDAPLGPAIKFAAVMSMLAGFWIGNKIYLAVKGSGTHPSMALSSILAGGIVLRVLSMTVVNYFVLLYIGPIFFGADYLNYAKLTVEGTTGWHFASNFEVLLYTLIFTAAYNAVNLLVAVIPAGLIVPPIATSFKNITSVETWITRRLHS